MPLNRSLIWILVSTLLISGSAFMGWLYYLHIYERRVHDEQYRVVAIVQHSGKAEALKTVYLSELLDLSLDNPINLYQLDVKEAEKKLLSSPLVKKGTIKKILPGTLYIDYEMRTPCVFLGDFTNTSLDREGVLFPFQPFFTPKHLPVLYLGLDKEQYKWGNCLKDHPQLCLAFHIMCLFDEMNQGGFVIKQLDLSQFRAESYGQRQIVAVVEALGDVHRQNGKKFYLRLGSDHYEQDLVNFFTLNRKLASETKDQLKEQTIIDFRVPHLAFIKR